MRTNRVTALGVAAGLVAAAGIAVALTRDETAKARIVPAAAAVGYRVQGTYPPGTPLADGLHVPSGTRLVGTVFPDVSLGRPVGWSATLVLTGDPTKTFTDLESMVSSLAPNSRAGCLPAHDAQHIHDAWCEVTGRTERVGFEALVSYGTEPRDVRSAPTAAVTIRVGPRRYFGGAAPHSQPVPITPVFPGLTAPYAAPPDTGEVVGGFSDYQGTLRIEPGSEALTPVVAATIVVRVTGDPTSVFNAYVTQLSKRQGDKHVTIGDSRYGEWRSFTNDSSSDTGNAYLLMMTNAAGSYIQIRLV